MMIAIALWCGAPNRSYSRAQADACREQLLECVESKKDTLLCFKATKLKSFKAVVE